MNYRHAFHAGNFADLVKHAALLVMLRALTRGEPLTVIDTHGGAGTYDLDGQEARKSGESVAIERLLGEPEPPEALALLKAAVTRFSSDGRSYPGSPVLAVEALRPGDRLVACELHPEDAERLRRALGKHPNAKVAAGDGYGFVRENTPGGPLLVLIDPPFERPDDYEQAAGAMEGILRKNAGATVCVWLPLKDLETFDAFLRQVGAKALVVEVRLRPLIDPMKMNGCALVIANPTAGLEEALRPACEWVVKRLGEAGGRARIWTL